MTLTQTPPVDSDRLDQFLGRFVSDLGATDRGRQRGHRRPARPLPGAGRRPGARRASWPSAPAPPPRYVTEWLRGQAAGGYVTYDPETEAYSLTEEQAFALTDPDGPVYLPGAFQLALGACRPSRGSPRRSAPAPASAGTSTTTTCSSAASGSSAPATSPTWSRAGSRRWTASRPSCDGGRRGRRRRLRARRVDRADGRGVPDTRPFVGSDYHAGSIELARKRAADAGVADRVTLRGRLGADVRRTGYDLVTTFDCLHDMGDPVGAARHVRDALAPRRHLADRRAVAGDTVEDNLNPVGRVYYSFSTFLCVPNALSQPGGYALGAQAGEAAIGDVVTEAGFTRFRRAAETPFNLVYEVRP